jgi:hypothetical protein
MNRKLSLFLGIALCLLLAAAGSAAAQENPLAPSVALGSGFTYQGRLVDNNTPASGNFDFLFLLYDASLGGAQVGGTVTVNDLAVSDGYFTAAPDFGAAVFNGQARWLEVQVRSGASTGAYTVLSPRQALSAAPYALYSLAAPWSGLSGIPAGFADGVDNDTTYTAGQGLTLSGPSFSLNTGFTDGRYWSLGGNSGTNPASQYLGTTDNTPLELRVNSGRALRIEPYPKGPNIISGFTGNTITSGVYGATLFGGGISQNNTVYPNRISDIFGTISGGIDNQAGDNDADVTDSSYATIGGGVYNIAGGYASTIGGGSFNQAVKEFTTIAGGQNNLSDGYTATIGGGTGNKASGLRSTVAGGNNNSSNGMYASVAGGNGNLASGDVSVIGGGENNTASNLYSTIAGGNMNKALGSGSTIGGGTNNTADQQQATIGGGNNNWANSQGATIAGGNTNNAFGLYASICGGFTNFAGNEAATVCGGQLNNATGINSTISGGKSNNASGEYTTIGGGFNNSASQGSTVGGGSFNNADVFFATIGGGVENRASDLSTVGGGYQNKASSTHSTVGGGSGNIASGESSTVSGGSGNLASAFGASVGGGEGNSAGGSRATVGGGFANIAGGQNSSIGGGESNTSSGYVSTISGGFTNAASKDGATVGGGQFNSANGINSTVSGGFSNVATGIQGIVPGGYFSHASGNYTFAAGTRAKAIYDGSFVWADGNNFDFSSQVNNQFSARATGGFRLATGIDGAGNVTWRCSMVNGESWACTSDRNMKENFAEVDSLAILEKVSQMPVLYWNAKGADPNVKHLGPMAQDFYAAFGLGTSDTTISTIDLDGVALAAIQGLNQLSQQQAEQIADLNAENESLKTQLSDIEARLSALESQAQPQATAPNLWNVLPYLGLAALGIGFVWQVRNKRGLR